MKETPGTQFEYFSMITYSRFGTQYDVIQNNYKYTTVIHISLYLRRATVFVLYFMLINN